MTNVLDGIKVLDFGRYIAGPWCGALLGDFGADVVRIDKIGGSEDRHVVPMSDDGSGAMFMQMNRNKRGMTLDPTLPEGREIQQRLIAGADVVIANLPEAARVKLGLDYDTLKSIKPDIILTSATAFGTTGPYATKVGFDLVAQAMSGAMYLSGNEGQPMRSYYPWVDYGTATLAALGTLAAIMHRKATGEGQQVEGSLLGTALTNANATLIEQALVQKNRVASGNRGQLSAPADAYDTTDGQIIVLALGPGMHRRWAKLMGETHWLDDPRFADDDSRAEHGEIISARMREWCAARTTEQALAGLEEARLPAAPVLSPQQALDDPHIQAAGFMQPVDYPGLPGPAPVAGTPVKLSKTPGSIRRRAPQLGEHTDEILGELGYDAAAIAKFREIKAI
ncbi:MAG: Succinyl-CoA--L-malate CoA-transferase beta subunit [Alphaproteobacteria bacterium MarineAlpha10_Bin3]|jgi:crotonobetainyl-CoA:carnitine CoA-transferase CaiB-like acyl-CoA transferase|nr:MAG: Succinyl-CoA--L-malate CoA-transferase beta subunit [Alphaproteobacteria bacterium MarineAlpha10_Bin3]PPR68908.1 MAG: Succinyl-CoA--L-malate CoA-transferase beta subunit [Alphaproteobacteria bacterium MarineAlpha4_Bin1]